MVKFTGHTITSDSALGGKIIEKSLRFNRSGSHRINRTAAHAGNRRTWTKSFWVKRTSEDRRMLHAYYTSGTDVAVISFREYGNFAFYDFYNGYRVHFETSARFRDCTAWTHFVVSLDTPQSTESERVKIYVNGSRVTAFNTAVYPSRHLEVSFNQNTLEAWGTEGTNQRLHFDGYLSDVWYIDGQALDPSHFGYTESQTGIWKPKNYSPTGPNNGTTWSSTTNMNANVFDGRVSGTNFLAQVSNGYYTATTAPFTIKQSLAVVTGDGYHWGARLNGSTEVTTGNLSSTMGVTDRSIVNFDLSSVSLPLDITNLQIKAGTGSSGSTYIYAIVVDGVVLMDGDLSNVGKNGYHLEFKDDSGTTATTMGKDTSGRGNNWTPVNFSVASDYMTDIVTDSPTNNFCVLNYNGGSGNKPVDGGLSGSAAGTSGWRHSYGTFPLTRGKWYWEYRFNGNVDGSNGIFMGLAHADLTYERNINSDSADMYGRQTNTRYSNGTNTGSHFPNFSSGDTIQFAFDADRGVMWSGLNNTWTGAEPSTGNSPSFTGIDASKGYVPMTGSYGSNNYNKVNFGQQGFKYTPPSGFKAICSEFMEMPEAKILNPKKHFGDLYYTGNGGTQSITGLEFQPDFVWIKRRDDGHHHALFDSVRGNLKSLSTSRIDLAEYNETASLSEFLENGMKFTGQGYFYTNVNSAAFVAWCWRGGSPINYTSGSVFFQPNYDVLQLASTTDFDFGTGDFTMEMYYRAERYNQTPYLFEFRASGGNEVGAIVCYVQSSGEAVFWYNGSNRVISNGSITLRKWTHIAFVRHSGTTKMYIDGVAQSQTYSDSNDYGDGGKPLMIGRRRTQSTQSWDGELSNVRIVKGTAVYTSNFTPSTTPLTNVSGTVLLCCQSKTDVTEAAVKPGTITTAGDPRSVQRNPFDAYSVDGVGYSTTADAGITEGTIPINGASVNRKAGFSVITYTGNNTGGATVAHGLGIAPKACIIKCYTHTNLNWDFQAFGTVRMDFNTTATDQGNGQTQYTSTTFSLSNTSNVRNGSDRGYVCYLFAEIPGYSKIGTYKGFGNENGPVIYCGFRPKFVIVKSTTHGEHWNIPVDTYNYNGVDKTLSSNLANAERDMSGSGLYGDAMDYLSDGFKIKNIDGNYNRGGATYFFMAFADVPNLPHFNQYPTGR